MDVITYEQWRKKPAEYKCVRMVEGGALVRMVLKFSETGGTMLVPVCVVDAQGNEVPIRRRKKGGQKYE